MLWTFNSRPHAEVDDTDWSAGCEGQSFNSRPHAEVDILKIDVGMKLLSFNSRPHAEVDVLSGLVRRRSDDFQLTTSRRGRPCLKTIHGTIGPFNSRPHAEVDSESKDAITDAIVLSTHDLTQRSTLRFCHTSNICFFQLTTSRRGRPTGQCDMQIAFPFQLTTSRRGRHRSSGYSRDRYSFQLTTSRRGRRIPRTPFAQPDPFNSRPHAEVDFWPSISL